VQQQCKVGESHRRMHILQKRT